MEKTAIVRLGFFLGIFLLMALWEMIAPSFSGAGGDGGH